jgi:hypothetical protein
MTRVFIGSEFMQILLFRSEYLLRVAKKMGLDRGSSPQSGTDSPKCPKFHSFRLKRIPGSKQHSIQASHRNF